MSCGDGSENQTKIPETNTGHSSQAKNHPIEYSSGDEEDQVLTASNDVAPPIIDHEIRSPSGWVDDTDFDPNIEVMPIYLPEETIDFAQVFSSMEKPLQIQSIYNKRDTVITFKEGTILTIRANSFVTESEENLLTSNIELSVGEYYDLDDLLSNNLNTQTKNGLLETGGTIYIEAKSGGQKCKLKDGSTIDIKFPTDNKLANMQLFEGDWVEDRIVWDVDYDAPTETIDYDPGVDAQFPGGVERLWWYIQHEVYYPREAHDNSEQGRVFVAFNVNIDGSIDSVKIVKGVSKSLDREAMRVIRKMPRWIPANYNGNKYKSEVRLPIKFILDEGQARRGNSSKPSNADAFTKSADDKGSNPDEISNYLLSSATLGWINCDRFINNKNPKVDILIESDFAQHENIKIVFDNQKAIMQSVVSGNTHKFSNLPTYEPITIVAVKVMNNQLYFAVHKTNIDYYGIGPLQYKECTMNELQLAMSKLNWD